MDEALVRILADHELKHQEIRSIEGLINHFERLKIAVNSLSSMVTHSTNNQGLTPQIFQSQVHEPAKKIISYFTNVRRELGGNY